MLPIYLTGKYKWKNAHLSLCKKAHYLQCCVTCVCETYMECTFSSRTWCFSALKGPVSISPPQEAASSITVSVNIVSPHLPIGSLCFGLQHLCFQTCVLTGPHLALLSGIPLPKRIKLISTLHAASILKCLCSKTSFSLLLASLPAGFSLLLFVFHILFLVSRLLWKMFLWNGWDLMQLEDDKSCVIID